MKAERIESRKKPGTYSYRFLMTESEYATLSEDSEGCCIACGESASGVEPDARGYTCEACGAPKVFGLEELLLLNRVVLK